MPNIKKITNFSTVFALLLIFILSAILNPVKLEARTARSGYDGVFADFLKALNANSQHMTGSDKFCLYGSDGISLILESEIKNTLQIKENQKKFTGCKIIYIAKNKSRYVRAFIEPMNDSTALTVAVFDGFVNDGGMMHVGIGRRNFELTVDSKILKKSKLKIDSSITGLIIDNNGK